MTVAEVERPWVAPGDVRLRVFATLTIVFGSLLVYLDMPTGVSELSLYRYCAYGMLAVLAIALGIEGFGGVRSLARVDIVAIWTLYFLTFAEFLHPHVRVLFQGDTGNADRASMLVMVGTVGIAVGRHIGVPFRARPEDVRLPQLSSVAFLRMFFLFTFLGYFYVLLTTDGNVFEIFSSLMKQRFDRPWQRGQQGDWRSFLTELQLLLYIVAALGGFIFANAKAYGRKARFGVAAVLIFMTFFDFCEGARNVLIIKAGLFLLTFFMASRQKHTFRLLMTTAIGAATLWVVSGYMLDFRNQGLVSYVDNGARQTQDEGFMIDNNMITIARAISVFPELYPYPGIQVVVQVVTKWIPRALWPGKPVGWSTNVEDALATGGGYTLALTYVGEAYLIAGMPTLILVSLLIGALTSWWTRVGLAARTNLDLIYYASGFFAASLGMRSVQFVTIAMVPTFAFYVVGKFLARRKRKPVMLARTR